MAKKFNLEKDCKNCRWAKFPSWSDVYAFCMNGAGNVMFEAETPLDFTVDDISRCTLFEYKGF